MATRGLWLEAPAGPVAAWLTEPTLPTATSGIGVVVLPPIGYACSSSHRFARTLAERFAADGALVARVDHPGTGDSDLDAAEITSLTAWRQTLPTAVATLRRMGATAVVVLGVQLGATLALLDAPAAAVDGIVTIEPALSGSRWVRTFRLLGIGDPDGGAALGGYLVTREVLEELSTLRVAAPPDIPVWDVPDQPATQAFLQRPAEEATVDPGLVEEIATWVGRLTPVGGPAVGVPVVVPQTAATVHRHGRPVWEEFVELGPDRLVGVLSTAGSSDALYVLVNSGSDPHTGPGRAWVELARDLALRGQPTLRVDLRGWGESPDGPTAPGRPYDQHGVGDIARLVAALHAQGRRVVLGGLCAGAWIAMAAARQTSVDGLVVLNPQLYWQPGDPVEARMETTRQRRLPEIEEIRGQSSRWDDEDDRGLRPPAAQLLDDLVSAGTPCSLVFAAGDDGLEYLRDRLARRLEAAQASGVLTVTELPGVDHGMQRTWLRPIVFEAVAAEITRTLTAR